jgi:hypothetical protein
VLVEFHSTRLRAARKERRLPSAFTVLRLITNSSTPIAERPTLLDQLGAKTSVLYVGY